MRRRTRLVRPKRSKIWDTVQIGGGTAGDPGTLNAGDRAIDWLIPPDTFVEEYNEPTLLRTMVTQMTNSADLMVPGDFYTVGFGILLWRSTLGTPTPNDVPCAVNGGFYDWIFRQVVHLPHGPGDIGEFNRMLEWTDGESLAKRKIPAGYGLLYVLESSVNSDVGMNFYIDVKMLFADNGPG